MSGSLSESLPAGHPPNTPVLSLKLGAKMFAPLQVNTSNSLILPQDFFDVLHDLLIAFGLHIHEDLLTRIWKQEVKGGRNPKNSAACSSASNGGNWDVL